MEESNDKKVEDDEKPPNGATTVSTDANGSTASDQDKNVTEDSEGHSSSGIKDEEMEEITMPQPESNGKKVTLSQSSTNKDEASINTQSDDDNNTSKGSKQEQTQYSTRGRNSSKETDQDIIKDRLDRISSSHREFEDDISFGVERERSHSAPSTSFLDNVNEQQRRTRTRFLPAVDGIHVLHKSEIKHDLQLARTVISSSGVSSTLSRRTRGGKRRDDEDVEMADEEGGNGPSEDEQMTDIAPTDNTNNSSDHSRAFVAPNIEQLHRHIYNNGDTRDSSSGGDTAKISGYASASPHIVESATAFNPPRPPESVGPKKKHRMMRWENRPEDVEKDLDSYRKTVQRTRKELKNAQAERERIEAVSSYLRSHYLCQLSALNEEGYKLNQEFGKIQLDCVKAADLLQSRTRSRGVGKGSYVMKDVLNILKNKGSEVSSLPLGDEMGGKGEPSSGIGGIDSKGFVDWTRGDEVKSEPLANGFVLVGDKVQTPYGKGEVTHVYGPTLLDVKRENLENEIKTGPNSGTSDKTVQHGFGAADKDSLNHDNDETKRSTSNVAEHKSSVGTKKNAKNESQRKSQQNSKEVEKNNAEIMNVGDLLPPRVCVRLPFGTGYFRMDQVVANEPVASYSDSMLVSRWRKMIDTSLEMAGCIDFAAMADEPDISTPDGRDFIPGDIKNDDEDDIDSSSNGTNGKKTNRFLPYGSAMLPTSCGRGVKLHDFPIASLEKEMDLKLLANEAVLGKKNNKGVPKMFRQWEDIRDEVSVLHAQVLQRRNEINRQRRIRIMNERSLASARDQSSRVENLVLEMRADLKSLKDRLDDELIELGIEGETPGRLLTKHYEREENYESDFIKRVNQKRKSRPSRERYHHPSISTKQTRRQRSASGTPDTNDNHSYAESDRVSIEGKSRREICTDDDLEEGRQAKRPRQKSIDL